MNLICPYFPSAKVVKEFMKKNLMFVILASFVSFNAFAQTGSHGIHSHQMQRDQPIAPCDFAPREIQNAKDDLDECGIQYDSVIFDQLESALRSDLRFFAAKRYNSHVGSMIKQIELDYEYEIIPNADSQCQEALSASLEALENAVGAQLFSCSWINHLR
jgi:hypothetical protein